MKLSYMILAEKIILEKDGFSPTAVNITNDLEIYLQDSSGQAVTNPGHLPFAYSLLMVWEREDEPGGTYMTRIDILDPSGQKLQEVEGIPVIFQNEKANRRFVGRVNFDGFPCVGSGKYSIRAFTEQDTEPSGSWTFNILLRDSNPAGGELKNVRLAR